MATVGDSSVENRTGRHHKGREQDLASPQAGVYHGTITRYLKGNDYYSVVIEFENQPYPLQCVWAAGFFSNLMGFNSNYVPQIGSDCLIYVPGGKVGYIVGGLPTHAYYDRKGPNRRVTTGGKGELENSQYSRQQFFSWHRRLMHEHEKQPNEVHSNRYNWANQPAGDLTEGELDITNLMGVGLQLIRHFAILKGSDFAKVEASIIDDMVRIISHTFRHFSSFGDYKIYNDSGRLNVVWDGTTNDWESHGLENPEDERATVDGDIVDIETDKFTNEAKWRFSSYIGFLGDFINLFITDKLEATKPEIHLNRSGKGRMHVNEDGSFLVQSVNDIVLERVCRIPVPLQQCAEHDPDGDGFITNEELPFPKDLEPIKCWDWEKSGGVDKSFHCVFQLREYGRWFSNYYSKARFMQLKKDWYVPSESETPAPLRTDDGEIDKEVANSGREYPGLTPDVIKEGPVTHAEVYSAIRMYRDGSVSVSDGFENSVVMSRNGITVASSTNLQLEAAGSVNIVAGRDINLVSHNSVDVNALRGGVSLRGENFIQQHSNGGILIESDSVEGGEIWSSDDIEDPNLPQTDPERLAGICIWSKNSSMRLISAADMGLRTTYGKQIFAGFHQIWKSEMPIVFNNTVAIIQDLTMTKGLLWSDMSMVEKLFIGNDYRGMFGIWGHVIGDGVMNEPENKNENDVVIGPTKWIEKEKEKADTIGAPTSLVFDPFDDAREVANAFKQRDWNGKFMHRTIEEYGTASSAANSQGAIYESITQQGLRFSAENKELKPGDEYEFWSLDAYGRLNAFADGPRGHCWPGDDKQHFTLPSASEMTPLWEPSMKTDFNNYGTALELTDILLNRLKD